MRLLKAFILLAFVLAMAVLLHNNSDQDVSIWLFPGQLLEDVNLALALVSTLGIGILLGFLLGLLDILKHQRETRRQRRQLKQLTQELNALRHSDLAQDIFKETGKKQIKSKTEPSKESPQETP